MQYDDVVCGGEEYLKGTWLKNNGLCSIRRPGQEGVEKIVDQSTICGSTVCGRYWGTTFTQSLNIIVRLYDILKAQKHRKMGIFCRFPGSADYSQALFPGFKIKK